MRSVGRLVKTSFHDLPGILKATSTANAQSPHDGGRIRVSTWQGRQFIGSWTEHNQVRKDNMQFNERKAQALEIFTQHSELRPPEWSVVADFYPIRASFSYLLRLHRM